MSSICTSDRPGVTDWLQSVLNRTTYLPVTAAPVPSHENFGFVSYGS